MKNNISFANVYITKIPEKEPEKVYSKERQMYIDSTYNENLKRQRYFVWKLLEFAINDSLGLNPEKIIFSIDENGKWSCNECYFSLSHSNDAIAVAISNQPIGIDIEIAEYIIHPHLENKILTEKEITEYSSIPKDQRIDFLLKKWCAKESMFKLGNLKQFKPRTIETESNVSIGTVLISEQIFYYAVSTIIPETLNIKQDIII